MFYYFLYSDNLDINHVQRLVLFYNINYFIIMYITTIKLL